MSRVSILIELRKIANSLLDDNLNIRVEPVGYIKNSKLDEYRQELLRDLIVLIKDSDIVNDETKMYIFNPVTIKEVHKEIVDLLDEDIPFNTTKSKVQYGKSKLEGLLGGIINILVNNSGELEDSPERLYEIISEYTGNDIRDRFVIDLDKNVYNTEISDNEFNDLLQTILPYLKTHVDSVSNILGEEKVGYFNYITSGCRLGSIDKERLNTLKEIVEYE